MRIIMWKIHSRVVTGILFQRFDTEYEKTPRYVIHTQRNGKQKFTKNDNLRSFYTATKTVKSRYRKSIY